MLLSKCNINTLTARQELQNKHVRIIVRIGVERQQVKVYKITLRTSDSCPQFSCISANQHTVHSEK